MGVPRCNFQENSRSQHIKNEINFLRRDRWLSFSGKMICTYLLNIKFFFFRFIFLGIYSLEMVIRTIAKGFILNNYTYLRNAWNWLDFLVIFSGYLTSFIEMGNLAGLRTFRVLRALKTISILPSKYKFILDLTQMTVIIDRLGRQGP